MTPAARLAAAAIAGTLVLLWSWFVLLSPPASVPGWLAAALASLPMLPALALLLARRRGAGFWGAVAALFYFSFGVMEAWANPPARTFALALAAVSAALVLAASWDGLRARFGGRGRRADV